LKSNIFPPRDHLDLLPATQESISPGDQRRHFTICHAARQHPITAVRIHPAHTFSAENDHGLFDAPGSSFGLIDLVLGSRRKKALPAQRFRSRVFLASLLLLGGGLPAPASRW
jgi:hypothetical protein